MENTNNPPVSALPPQPPIAETPFANPAIPPVDNSQEPTITEVAPIEPVATITPPIVQENPSQPPKRSPMKFILFIFFLIIIAGLGLGGWWGYENIYLSPERIVGKAIAEIPQMSTYEFSSAATIKTTYESSPTYNLVPSAFTINLNGKSDINSRSHSLSAQVDNYGKLELRAFNDSLFVYLSEVPDSIIGTYSSLENTWFQIDFEKVAKDLLGKEYSPDNLGISADQKTAFAESFKNNPFIKITGKLPSETIDGQVMFHYKYEIDKENFKKLMLEMEKSYSKNEASDAADKIRSEYYDKFDFVPGEIWIGKKDNFLHKFTFGSIYKSQYSSMSFDLSLQIKNINSDVGVEKPSEFKTWDELMTILGLNAEAQLMQARDTQRRSDLLAITNSIYQFAAEHNGNLPDTDGVATRFTFPTKEICIGTSPECFDLAHAGISANKDTIVPTYIAAMPKDPSLGTEENTGYTIYQDENGRVVATAKGEKTPEIKVTR